MRHVAVFFALAAAGSVTWVSSPALAQERESGTMTESISSTSMADPRSIAQDWLTLPEGDATLGGTLRFLTAAEGGLGEEQLRFTDVVLLDLNGRIALSGRTELFGGLTLLPKQPSSTGELIWQGAGLGGRMGFAERFAALVHASVGPTLAHSGYWAMADVGVEVRKSLHPTFRFQGMLGGSATALFLEVTPEGAPERRLGFGEIIADGEMVFRAPEGQVAVWIGTQFRFPVGPYASPASARAELDPQTRVNFRMGGVLAYIRDWDLFAEFVVTDRGDPSDPTTQLPILDGGFDQTTLVLGITRRFQRESRRGNNPAYESW